MKDAEPQGSPDEGVVAEEATDLINTKLSMAGSVSSTIASMTSLLDEVTVSKPHIAAEVLHIAMERGGIDPELMQQIVTGYFESGVSLANKIRGGDDGAKLRSLTPFVTHMLTHTSKAVREIGMEVTRMSDIYAPDVTQVSLRIRDDAGKMEQLALRTSESVTDIRERFQMELGTALSETIKFKQTDA